MLLLLALTALAEPPSRALLDDIDRWEEGQARFLAGPLGCWDLAGTARQELTFHQPPDFFGGGRNEVMVMEGPVRGRMIDGAWTAELEDELKPVGHEMDIDIGVTPLFGTRPERPEGDGSVSISVGGESAGVQVSDGIGSSVNALTEAIEELSADVETSLAQWDDEQKAVLYLRELPLAQQDRRAIKVTVRFPEGQAVADRIDAVWPSPVKVGEWPLRAKIRDGQMHAVGHQHGEHVLPWAESLSLVVGALGYTVGFEQRVGWTSATPCAPDPGEPVAE